MPTYGNDGGRIITPHVDQTGRAGKDSPAGDVQLPNESGRSDLYTQTSEVHIPPGGAPIRYTGPVGEATPPGSAVEYTDKGSTWRGPVHAGPTKKVK